MTFAINGDAEGDVRGTIARRTQLLQGQVSEFLRLFSRIDSPAARAENVRATNELSIVVNTLLCRSYAKLAGGTLGSAESHAWVPFVESIRNDLRRIASVQLTGESKRVGSAISKLRNTIDSNPSGAVN